MEINEESNTYTQNPDGQWVPATPLPYQSSWLGRLSCKFGKHVEVYPEFRTSDKRQCLRCGKNLDK